MPAAHRREIVEREALRMRSQVAWLVFQHARNGLAALFAGVLARAGKLLAAGASLIANRPARHRGERAASAMPASRNAADGHC